MADNLLIIVSRKKEYESNNGKGYTKSVKQNHGKMKVFVILLISNKLATIIIKTNHETTNGCSYKKDIFKVDKNKIGNTPNLYGVINIA